METAFYVVGSALVVIALVVSFIGMRSDNFPSSAALRIGTMFVALVVIATATLAVRASEHEAQEREHEENVEASEAEAEQTLENQDVGDQQAPGDRDQVDQGDVSGSSGQGDPAAGMQVFADQGCDGCHSLQAADATGEIGPNLDAELADKDEAFIETSIIDPSAEVVEGFGDGIMPADYGEVIPPDQLADLVAFLYESTRAK